MADATAPDERRARIQIDARGIVGGAIVGIVLVEWIVWREHRRNQGRDEDGPDDGAADYAPRVDLDARAALIGRGGVSHAAASDRAR